MDERDGASGPGLSEFDLIARYFAPLAAGFPGALGLADDAALIDVTPGTRLVATTDALVAGVHFLPDDPADRVARKLLRVSLSDLAAMGAVPRAYLLVAAFPTDINPDWLQGFAAGLAADQAEFGIVLAGGDTVAAGGALTLAVTALGEVAWGRELRRSTAQPDDLIFVSGTLGDSALGLAVLRGEAPSLMAAARAAARDRYQLPQPRLALGGRLAGLASAAIDISDGLVADLGHICAGSGLAARIESAHLPLSAAGHAALAADPSFLISALTGGDDYELLFTVAAHDADRVSALAAALDLRLTLIGKMTTGHGVRVVDADGVDITPTGSGYRHF